jgi:enoyl reductase-like protein
MQAVGLRLCQKSCKTMPCINSIEVDVRRWYGRKSAFYGQIEDITAGRANEGKVALKAWACHS